MFILLNSYIIKLKQISKGATSLQKFLRNILFLTILFSANLLVIHAKANTNTFPDVNSNREEILYLTGQGIIKGYPNGNFGPNDPITRVQAVLMIIRELEIDTSNAPNPHFKDVPQDSYGYNEIAKAAQLGIISGKGDGTFDPNGNLTRSQMAKILVNAYHLKGTSNNNFKDVSKNDIMFPYIQTLASHTITNGYPDGTFHPNETLVRAHFAVFLSRLLNENFIPTQLATTYNTEDLAINSQSVLVIELYDENDELVSQGSGFIVANQLIATNFHVVSGGSKAVAILDDGEKIELEGVVAYDEYQDVAILKPSSKIGYPALPLSSYSNIKKGEKVVAIGSPYGFKNSMSEGIVSSLQTFEDAAGLVNAIQTTAKITYGSSGGPLLDMKGHVIGINSFGIEDLNFAVSSDYISNLINKYKGTNFDSIPFKNFSTLPIDSFEDEEDWEDEVIQ